MNVTSVVLKQVYEACNAINFKNSNDVCFNHFMNHPQLLLIKWSNDGWSTWNLGDKFSLSMGKRLRIYNFSFQETFQFGHFLFLLQFSPSGQVWQGWFPKLQFTIKSHDHDDHDDDQWSSISNTIITITSKHLSNHHNYRRPGRWRAAPLFLLVIVIRSHLDHDHDDFIDHDDKITMAKVALVIISLITILDMDYKKDV